MKQAIVIFLTFFWSGFISAQIEGHYVPIDPRGPLEKHKIPVTENALTALKDILVHLDCDISEFFQMSGIDIPKGGNCVLNVEDRRVEFELDRPSAETAVMLIGDLMLFCADAEIKKTQILERYAFEGHPQKGWTMVWQSPEDWKREGKQDDTDQSATAPVPQTRGKDKAKPESKPRSE